MKVLNVINNNVVSSLDEKNRKIVVMGKGIGFHKKPGEEIADTQVEKVFRLPDETHDRFMKLVKEREGVALSDDEAAFIAQHIINAEEDTDEKKDVKFLNLIRDILTIVQDDLELDFKDESIDYRRFMTHLKFFIRRVVKKDYSYGDDTADVYSELVKKCPGEYACAADIKKYVKDKLDYEASEEELIYLTVHLHRLTRCGKKQLEQEN